MPTNRSAKVPAKKGHDLSHIAAPLRSLAVPIDSLTLDPANARKHPEKNLDGIAGSLRVYGQCKPVVVRKATGVVVAGNGTLAAARALGWTHVAAAFVDMDAATAAGFSIADNRAAELAEWDDKALSRLIAAAGPSNDDRLDAMLAELRDTRAPTETIAPGDGGDDFDAAPSEEEATRCQPGDLWVFGGKHRLLVGDCTVPENVERLMGDGRAELIWTDPPYGVAIGDKNKFLNAIARSNRVEENLVNDTLDEDGLASMLTAAFGLATDYCREGASWYVAAPPGPLHTIFAIAMKRLGILRQMLIWKKNAATFSPLGTSYHWRHEPVLYGWLPNGPHRYYGGRKQDTVWEVDKPKASPDHPTMKPVALVQRAVENSSLAGQVVYDPFLGSGTTLIAAHRLGRVCYGCEIAPKYGDVILRRAEAEGLTCELAQ